MNIRKTSQIILSLIFILMIVLTISFISITNKVDEDIREMTSRVGNIIIWDKDTLQIIDASYIDRTYTLSNNKVVGEELVKRLELDNKTLN